MTEVLVAAALVVLGTTFVYAVVIVVARAADVDRTRAHVEEVDAPDLDALARIHRRRAGDDRSGGVAP